MKTIIAVLTLCLFSLGIRAQEVSTQTPPVVVTKTTHVVPGSNCRYGYDKCIKVVYKNVTDKAIKAVEFQIVFIDVMGDKHTYAHKFLTEGTGWHNSAVKPGTNGEAVWDNLLYAYCRKYEVTVEKVAFSDGTVWEAKAQ